MLSNSLSFSQSSANLKIIGIPDFSKGDNDECISIINSWSLEILGKPIIEGKSDHLASFLTAILEYSGHIIINSLEKTSVSNTLIDIHRLDKDLNSLNLKSTQKNIDNLEIVISDTELADIIYCFNKLLDDLNFNFEIEFSHNFKSSNLFNKFKKINFTDYILSPFLGFLLVALSSSILILSNIEDKDKTSDTSKILNIAENVIVKA